MKSHPQSIAKRPHKNPLRVVSATQKRRVIQWSKVDWNADPFDAHAVAKRLKCAVVTVNAMWRKVHGRKRKHSVLDCWNDWTLSSAEIARRCGVSHQCVSAYRKGVSRLIDDA